MADHISIPKSDFQALLRDVRRGIDVCGEVASLRFALRSISSRMGIDQKSAEQMSRAIKSCESVARLRVELVALERRLLEADMELTPVRPPSRQDIKAAFDASVDFAHGKKKRD